MATAAIRAQGTQFQVETTTPGTFLTVAEVNVIDWAGDSDELDVSSHSSLNGWREYIQGMKNAEISVELMFVPTHATHGATGRGLLALFISGAHVGMKIIWPGAALTASFTGFVRNFSPSAPTDGVLSATGTIRVSGNVTFT